MCFEVEVIVIEEISLIIVKREITMVLEGGEAQLY